MPLTKLPTGLILDDAVTSAKIADSTIIADNLATGSITSDKLDTTFDMSNHSLTFPENSINHRELNLTFSASDADKFLQISAAGALSWNAPGNYPITYASITGPIPASHIDNDTITSAMIDDLTIADSNISNGTITGSKLSTTLDLSTSATLTFPTDTTFTNVTITGNLKTEGTTTEVDTQNLLVKDNTITINDDEPGTGVTAGFAGIEINRGPGEDKATIMWNESIGRFEFKKGSQVVNLEYANVAPAADSVGYNQLIISNSSDPGPGVNTFLESDASGNFNFTQVNSSNFPLSGIITGTLQNNTIADDSIGTDKLEDYAITPDKLSRNLSFVGINTTLNAPDILTAINGASLFTISNTITFQDIIINGTLSIPGVASFTLPVELDSPVFTGTVTGVTATHVGLGNVDNTSDANKPISTATQTALNFKAPLANPAFTGTPTGITKAHLGLGNVDNESKATMFTSPTFTGTSVVPTIKLTPTSAEPTGSEGMVYYNSNMNKLRQYNGSAWVDVGVDVTTSTPSGMIAPFGMGTEPVGWLICDGRAISRTAYIALFLVIDDIWGPGNNSSTFNIPDLRGAYLRNIGTAILDANFVGPTAVGDYQSDQNSDHTHTMASDGSHQHSGPTGAIGFTAQNQAFFVVKDSPHNGGSYLTGAAGGHTHVITNEGGTEARVYNRGVQFMIKY